MAAIIVELRTQDLARRRVPAQGEPEWHCYQHLTILASGVNIKLSQEWVSVFAATTKGVFLIFR
jgi:hypothetical protein